MCVAAIKLGLGEVTISSSPTSIRQLLSSDLGGDSEGGEDK